MAPLKFNVYGYIFQSGVDVLLRSFTSALDALQSEFERAREDAFRYQQELEQGGNWIGEHDDDGNVIWDQTDNLNLRVEQAQEAQMTLCKAFALASYHQWERSIREWTGSGAHAKHETLVAKAKAKGVQVHPKLDALRDLANTLKHNNDKWGTQLYSTWRDVFFDSFEPKPGTDWYAAVRLYEKHILEAINIISFSGPTPQNPAPKLLEATGLNHS